MPFVSLTRLRLRSARFLPGFAYWTLASNRQVRRSTGFLTGWVGQEDFYTYWTATCWQEEAAMRAFRASGAHLTAMRKLLDWCDEASMAHWEQAEATVPDGPAALVRMRDAGRISKVRHPSPDHQAGRPAGTGVPREGQRLRPAG